MAGEPVFIRRLRRGCFGALGAVGDPGDVLGAPGAVGRRGSASDPGWSLPLATSTKAGMNFLPRLVIVVLFCG